MATINSHRKRQVWHPHLNRRSYGYSSGAPTGAATIMPDKSTNAETWGSGRRQFATMDEIFVRRYLGNILVTRHLTDANTGATTKIDLLRTTPGAMVNPDADHNPMKFMYSTNSVNSPVIYSTEVGGAQGYITYSRKRCGLLLNGGTSYKGIKVGSQMNYQQVVDVGGQQGGNIKSRATTLKWIGGMWREKK